MGHNILMFGPPKDRLVSGGGIRPYYLSKELGQLGVKMSEIWGWQTKSLSSDQIKNKMKLLKHSIKSGDGAHYLVETAKSEKFMKTLAKTKIPIILDFYDDEILQKKAYGIPIDDKASQQVKKNIDLSLSMSSHILFPSETLMKYYPLEIQDKGIIVMNASDPVHFKPVPLPGNHNIGILTGLTSGRGIEELLEACKILKNDFADLTVNIAHVSKGGVSSYEKEIKGIYNEEWITFRQNVSYFDGAQEFYQNCYLTVIPNLKNFYMDASTPIKLFDTMASARPIVVTDCFEQARIVKEENCGLICDFTPEDMANKISKLLSDREIAEKMGQNGRKAVEVRHSWSHRANNFFNEIVS